MRALLVLLLFAAGQAAPPAEHGPATTLSTLGHDPETGEVGAAVQPPAFSVGSGVLWAEPGVGAVAAQALVDASNRPEGPALLRRLVEMAQRHRWR